MATKRKNGLTRTQAKKVSQVKATGGVIPVGCFGGALSAEQVAERMAHKRSGAAGVHADSNLRRSVTSGRTNRVGSRSSARKAAVRDYA